MNLYNLTLQPPTGIYCAVYGNFSGNRVQEIAVSKGTMIELLKHDPNTGKLSVIISIELFGIVRSMMPFRQTGSQKDYLIIGSDSGRIVILEYDGIKNCFNKLHQETFGKSGCRRIVPGQYLAMDPKGRAVMIGAIEKQKFVYVLNRDTQARLTISSPLEAHKSYNIVFDIIGIDVGFENPLFASIEMDYEEGDNFKQDSTLYKAYQTLTFYELDLGLNHVVRKSSSKLEHFGNILLQVPGGNDGPGGLLICCENYIIYHNIHTGQEIKCLLPRRRDNLDVDDRSIIIGCVTTYRTKNIYFFLAQTEQGDIFKITLETEKEIVVEIRIKYFDTLPIASSLCVLKTGFLFCASEFGNHNLYQIIKLGEEDITPEFSSLSDTTLHKKFYYDQHNMTNLLLVDTIENYSPIIDCNIVDLMGEETPQIYILKGRGKESSFCILRHGLQITEMGITQLPACPNYVWTMKKDINDQYDSYIIVSFINATLILSLGGETVQEVTDTGFNINIHTINCGLLYDNSMVQIYSQGIRHISNDKKINEWCAPAKKEIIKATVNTRQIVLVLNNNELIYFELDNNGNLNEYSERIEMPSNIISLCLGPIRKNELRSKFLALTLVDETVRIISLDPHECLQPLSMQILPSLAESICIIESALNTSSDNSEQYHNNMLYLNIGLNNGVLLRTILDPISGDLTDTRTRYLGIKPVKIFHIKIGGNSAILAISSRNWLSYYYQNRYHLTPLTYDTFTHATSLQCEYCNGEESNGSNGGGIVSVIGNSLRILCIEKLGQIFNRSFYPLKYTPRKFILEESCKTFFILESEYNAYNSESVLTRKYHVANELKESFIMKESDEIVNEYIQNFMSRDIGNIPKAGIGTWASLIRVFNPIKMETLDLYEFEQNYGVHCMSLGRFPDRLIEYVLIVGVSHNLILNPRVSKDGGALYTFIVNMYSDTIKLQIMHITKLDEVPGAVLSSFYGKIVVGVGNLLRIYELGKQKLLKKCENKNIPNLITNIISFGDRLAVFDAQESFHFVKYKSYENRLSIFADDITPRWLTAGCFLDYHTIVGSDKFGNIFGVRLDSDIKDDIDEDPTGIKSLWDRGLLNGAPQKVDHLFHIHLGFTVNSLQKVSLMPGGNEVIVYTSLSGGIGVLAPCKNKQDVDFLQHIELYMRQEHQSIIGRDHLWYRSYYFPLKSVIDGDLCELFNSLPNDKQVQISNDLDKLPREVSKALEDMRTRCAF